MLKCWFKGHDDVESYEGETGKLCFSYNCARPQIIIRSTCRRCGRVKDNTFMSGMPHKAIPLTPEVAGRVLRDDFNTHKLGPTSKHSRFTCRPLINLDPPHR